MNTDNEIETAARAAIAGFSHAAGFWALPLVTGDPVMYLVTYLVFRAGALCRPQAGLQTRLEEEIIHLLPESRTVLDHLAAVTELIRGGVDLDKVCDTVLSRNAADLIHSGEFQRYIHLCEQAASQPSSPELLLPLLCSDDPRIREVAMKHVSTVRPA